VKTLAPRLPRVCGLPGQRLSPSLGARSKRRISAAIPSSRRSRATPFHKAAVMTFNKALPLALVAACAAFGVTATAPVQAKGCIKGAVVGGVGGHLLGGHTVAGAAVGCAVGHHEAGKKAREQRNAQAARNNAAAQPPMAASAP